MGTLTSACGGAALALVVFGCSAGVPVAAGTPAVAAGSPVVVTAPPPGSPSAVQSTAPAETSTAAPTPAGPKIFMSARHEYTITLPGDWLVSEAAGEWTNIAIVPENIPPAGPGGFDRFSHAGYGIVIAGSEATDLARSLPSWAANSVAASKTLFARCHYGSTKALTIGGEPAQVVPIDCGAGQASPNGDLAMVVHRGRGFVFFWRGRPGHVEEDLASFLAILNTVRFTS